MPATIKNSKNRRKEQQHQATVNQGIKVRHLDPGGKTSQIVIDQIEEKIGGETCKVD